MAEQPDKRNEFVYERTPLRKEDDNPSRESDRGLSNRKTGGTGPLIKIPREEGYDSDEPDKHTNSEPY